MKAIFSKQNRILYILIALFLLPVVSAHYVFHHANHWVSKSGTNYGRFVKKKIIWQTGAHPRPWQLVLSLDGECHQDCLNKLDKLSRLRLSMGRKLYDLDLVLLLPPQHKPLPTLEAQLESQNILWASLNEDNFVTWTQEFKSEPIILFGPEHKAVLKYPNVFESKKMAHDLQLLIK